MRMLTIAAAVISFAQPAHAGEKYVVQPVQAGNESVRYVRGEATVSLSRERGMVQVQPLAFDHGGMSFAVAVFNGGAEPSNFDLADVTLTVEGGSVPLYSRHELERKAKNRAMWAQIAVGVAGGLAAVSAANQRDVYTATTYTPRGTYRSVFTAPSAAGQVAATALAAGTGLGIAAIRNQLDATLEQLSVDIVQLTTVDPEDSYGGRIVAAKVKFPRGPTRVDMVVRWNGEDYPLAFQVAKPGTPAPRFVTRPEPAPEPEPEPVPAATPAA